MVKLVGVILAVQQNRVVPATKGIQTCPGLAIAAVDFDVALTRVERKFQRYHPCCDDHEPCGQVFAVCNKRSFWIIFGVALKE